MSEQEAVAIGSAIFLRDRVFEAVRADGRSLSMRQLALLLACFTSTEPITTRALAKQLDIPGPAMTRAVNRLVDGGFVRRQAHPKDGRSMILFIRKKGADYCAKLIGRETFLSDTLTDV